MAPSALRSMVPSGRRVPGKAAAMAAVQAGLLFTPWAMVSASSTSTRPSGA